MLQPLSVSYFAVKIGITETMLAETMLADLRAGYTGMLIQVHG